MHVDFGAKIDLGASVSCNLRPLCMSNSRAKSDLGTSVSCNLCPRSFLNATSFQEDHTKLIKKQISLVEFLFPSLDDFGVGLKTQQRKWDGLQENVCVKPCVGKTEKLNNLNMFSLRLVLISLIVNSFFSLNLPQKFPFEEIIRNRSCFQKFGDTSSYQMGKRVSA